MGIVLFTAFSWAGPTLAQDAAMEVTCAEIAFSRSAERRDRDGFAALLHPDARFITDRISRGVDEVLAGWSPFFDPNGPSIKWRPETVELAGDGTLALSRGPYRVVGVGPDGARHETWGTFISVWRLVGDGEWRVHFDTGADVGMEPTESHRRLLDADPPSVCESP